MKQIAQKMLWNERKNRMPAGLPAASGNDDDYTYCPLVEGGEKRFRLSSWELGLEIAEFSAGDWLPVYDDPYMIVLGENRKFTDSPYFTWHSGWNVSVAHEVWLHFRKTVPGKIQKIVERFRYSQLHLLKALRFCPDLLDLARSCLPLFWLIVEKNSDINVLKSSAFAELLRLKRRLILERLGYVGTGSAVRLLAKIAMPCFRDEDLFHLKGIMRSEAKIASLRHFQLISRVHLHAGENYPELLKYTFVHNELKRREASLSSFRSLVALYQDTCNMAREKAGYERFLNYGALYEDTDPGGVRESEKRMEDFLHTITGPGQLQRFHDELVTEMNMAEMNAGFMETLLDSHGGETFPPPPVPGSPAIRPIRSLPGLAREGREMKNCILSYGQRIYEGCFFPYRILEPERGTVGLDLTKNGPKIAEIRLKNNALPSPATIRAVKEWLDFMNQAETGKNGSGRKENKTE